MCVNGQAKFPQSFPEPEGFYMFPVRPGMQNYLSGTMGELRASHFHAGLDIKTQGVQGLETYASADGFVSRIKVSEGGYGNALYLQHPNGTTTVYAHLQKYNEAIALYVRAAQYEKQSFEIELFPKKDQFPLKKGDLLGYTGNSGSSGGPHLHFEIRDGQQRPINPLKQGFSEIKDNIPPEIRKVVLRTMDAHSRVNQQYGRFEFNVIKTGSFYTIPGNVNAYGNIGVELLAHDKLNGANNRNGVPCMELMVNGQQIFQQNIERFSFGETRNVLVHTDYESAQKKGQRFTKMYVDDGNTLPFYKTNATKGVLRVLRDSIYKVQINLWDNYNNSSQVLFKLEGKAGEGHLKSDNFAPPMQLQYKLMDNNLVIEAPVSGKESSCAYVYANRMKYELEPSYQINNTAIIIWDMDRGMPDSLIYKDDNIKFNFKAVIPGGKEFNYFGEHLDLHAGAGALFDTVFLTLGYHQDDSQKEYFDLCEDLYPLRRNITVTLKPSQIYPYPDKTFVYSVDKKGHTGFVGGTWQGKQLQFKTRNWGSYTILSDTVKPQIRPVRITAESLAFIIKDASSGIDSYQLKIDGKWVLMNYDYKKDLLRSEKLHQEQPFKGDLELKVVDKVGNISYYSTRL